MFRRASGVALFRKAADLIAALCLMRLSKTLRLKGRRDVRQVLGMSVLHACP